MRSSSETGRGPIEIIEEAFHLLRLASLPTLLSYYLGAAPFVLAVLFFWSDMSRGAFADERLAIETVALVFAFCWLKTWQVIFARQLHAQITGQTPPRLTFKRTCQIALTQGILQPAGLFLIPIALLLLFPIGWVYGYFQSVTALGAFDDYDLKTVFRKGLQQAALWPLQNNYVVFLFKGFGLFVFLNLFSGALMIPYLLSTLLGIQSVFVQSPWTFLNTTFFAAICGLTYLCVDPVVKAVYVLRCFYGESRHTAADLKAELRSYSAATPKLATLSVLLCLFVNIGTMPGSAADASLQTPPAKLVPSPPSPRPSPQGRGRRGGESVTPVDLDHAIDQVLKRPEYTWRLPREKKLEHDKKGALALFIQDVVDTIIGAVKTVGRWIDKFIKWIRSGSQASSGGQGPGIDWLFGARGLILLLVIIIAALLLLLLVQLWKRHHRSGIEEVAPEALPPAPNISDENVGADQLPEDGWITMARDLLARGELRLALRALYLASLAHLAQRNLITIARFKSNRDYQNELGRRAHALPELTGMFTENVSTFDRIWYGMHEVNGTLLDQFQRNVEKIKSS